MVGNSVTVLLGGVAGGVACGARVGARIMYMDAFSPLPSSSLTQHLVHLTSNTILSLPASLSPQCCTQRSWGAVVRRPLSPVLLPSSCRPAVLLSSRRPPVVPLSSRHPAVLPSSCCLLSSRHPPIIPLSSRHPAVSCRPAILLSSRRPPVVPLSPIIPPSSHCHACPLGCSPSLLPSSHNSRSHLESQLAWFKKALCWLYFTSLFRAVVFTP